MLRKSSLRVSLIGFPIAALVLGAQLMGCSSENTTLSAPEIGGPMGSAFPSLNGVTSTSAAGPTGL